MFPDGPFFPVVRRALLGALVTLLAVSGCSKRGPAPGSGFRMPPMPVETATVTQARVADRFEAVGTLEAGDAIVVVSELDGMVTALPFREGEAIAQGGVVAQLDDIQLQAEVARAEALRDQTRVTFERVKSVVDQGAGAPQDLDDAAAGLKVAEANLDVARARLAKTRIVAPWGGVLGSRRVSPGAFVRAGQPITDLTRLQEMKVSFSAPERYLGVLHRGAPVSVTTPAFPGDTLTGRIDVVEPVLDANLRSARLRARVPNPGGHLRPGMSANVVAVLSERASALTIPSEAVVVEGGQAYVFAVKSDSTVTRVAVALGTRTADRVEVVRGVDGGARVVRAGHQKLFEGAKVIPVQSAPGAAAGSGTGDSTAATPPGGERP